MLLLLVLCGLISSARSFSVGVGKADITGPIAEVGFMGYANPKQTGRGLLSRQWARAFVVREAEVKTAFVTIGACFPATSIKREVVRLLGPSWTLENVLISGEHTHAAPAGFNEHSLYSITSLGWQKNNWAVLCKGIAKAVERAEANMRDGATIRWAQGELLESNINRSPSSYLMNPAEERARFKYDVDKIFTTLRFEDNSTAPFASLSWFAVHGTSLFNNQRLVSQDNKGYASYLWERSEEPGFVAGFGQSNEGDVSPNVKGPFCLDTGKPCDGSHSTCNGKNKLCQGLGHFGLDDQRSCQQIGANQFGEAKRLFDAASSQLSGQVQFIHRYVDMSNVTVRPPFTISGKEEHTCSGALGDSMAAGTTDGPGDFNFVQGTNGTGNEYWNFIAGFLARPTQELKECQAPKPILLWTQGVTFPAPWTQSVLPLQLFRWGELVLIAVPGEFTTMSGRRLRNTVRQAFSDAGVDTSAMVFVIAGLSNTYSHYIATREEYMAQRYEAASTLFGPATLEAYQQEFYELATLMAHGKQVPAGGPVPPDLTGKTFNFLPGVLVDGAPVGKSFGDVLVPPAAKYARGATVNVTFVGSDPRTNYMTESSYLYVQKKMGSTWTNVYDDNDWCTRYHWLRKGVDQSHVIVQWNIEAQEKPGVYRIFMQSYHKPLVGALKAYNGTSAAFEVV